MTQKLFDLWQRRHITG